MQLPFMGIGLGPVFTAKAVSARIWQVIRGRRFLRSASKSDRDANFNCFSPFSCATETT
jgi:hypothetical protein